MIKKIVFMALICSPLIFYGQVSEKIASAMKVFNNDEQLKFALSSLYIIDGETGEMVFDQNSNVGMATASTEKIITAATAFDLLGKDYKYQTKFGIITTPAGKSLYIDPSGDPTLGSWRWEETKEDLLLKQLKEAIRKTGIRQLNGIIVNTRIWGQQAIPDAWTWEDLGNYYGAGAQGLNWRENQFDIVLQSGAEGTDVAVVKTIPHLYNYKIVSRAKAAGPSTGDNTLLYYPSMGKIAGELKGTIPANKKNFIVSGSIYDPANQFAKTIIDTLKGVVEFKKQEVQTIDLTSEKIDWVFTNTSPNLSKIIYWFLRKSINLYGEALLKTLAAQSNEQASSSAGIHIVKQHWKKNGVDEEALHLYDGSGLSPQNRVTTRAQVTVLKYAQQQPWFSDYYEALPLYNDIKMKSGTINRVKGFAGYHTSSSGKSYIFSFLVNNYNGSQYTLVRKMYKVLDNLK